MAFVPLEDMENVQPRGATTGTGERAYIHNFIANPEIAKRYQQSLGDEIRTYGPGWDYAWRKKGSNGPWTPADAHTFGGWILNHVADAVIAAGSGIAATLAAGGSLPTGPGAIVAGGIAGAAAGGGLEAIRQGIGHLTGVPDNLDVGEIAAQTIGGGLAAPIGAATGYAARGFGRVIGKSLTHMGKVIPELAATVADIKPLSRSGKIGTTAGQVLMAGARATRGGRIPLVDPEQAGGLLRDALRWINRVKFPEIIEADARVAKATTPFDLTRAMKELEDRTLRQVGSREVSATRRIITEAEYTAEKRARTRGSRFDFTKQPGEEAGQFDVGIDSETGGLSGSGPARSFRDTTTTRTVEEPVMELVGKSARLREEAAVAPQMSKDISDFLTRIRVATQYDGDWSQTPGGVATMIRRILQKEASGVGAYQGAGPSKAYARVIRRAAAKTRAAIERTMEPIDPEFTTLMKTAYDKLNILDDFNSKMRISDFGPAGEAAATRFVRGVHGDNNISYLNALNDLDTHFSTGLRGRLVNRAIRAIELANLGERIGERGRGSLLPRITSGGHVRSAAALIGFSTYYGGPVGAAVSGVLTSPKFILRAAGPVAAAGQQAQSVAAALARVHLGGASRVLATGVADMGAVALMRQTISREGGGSKQLVRQEEGRPRRKILIGG